MIEDPGSVENRLRTFIVRSLIRNESYPLQANEPLITSGLVDSFGLAELAVFVEREFNVYIPNEDLTVERLDTLELMVKRVMQGDP